MRASLPTRTSASRVPFEFVGLARQFRSAVVAQHPRAVAAMDRIVLPLRGRHYSKQVPSPTAFAKVAQAWREQVPSAGRLSLATTYDVRRLAIIEVRAIPTDFGFNEWAEGATESCLIVIVSALIISAGHFSFTSALAASVSLHALARRFQRGRDNSDAAIRADLAALATPVDDVLEASGDFRVLTADGQWIGEPTETEDRGKLKTILAVRTFVSSDMTEDPATLAYADAAQ
jgi:hypothetical protein